MNKNKKIFLVNAVISGFIAFFIADFCASGTIAENPTDQKYVAPEFFVILLMWAIGFLFGLITSLKFPSEQFRVFAIVIMWVSIPLGFQIGMVWAIWANESSVAYAIQEVLVEQ
ncbi:hypothetical protein [Terribacillus sp. AE2B 122]|uniref:hypothetical protein n=1 Tax=Terribacillus sp. AE2B 122 TaxID=1331902 RepID=UPI0015829E6C|nr:hypothetical protein [Terribacillus sp. AE2B 122]